MNPTLSNLKTGDNLRYNEIAKPVKHKQMKSGIAAHVATTVSLSFALLAVVAALSIQFTIGFSAAAYWLPHTALPTLNGFFSGLQVWQGATYVALPIATGVGGTGVAVHQMKNRSKKPLPPPIPSRPVSPSPAPLQPPLDSGYRPVPSDIPSELEPLLGDQSRSPSPAQAPTRKPVWEDCETESSEGSETSQFNFLITPPNDRFQWLMDISQTNLRAIDYPQPSSYASREIASPDESNEEIIDMGPLREMTTPHPLYSMNPSMSVLNQWLADQLSAINRREPAVPLSAQEIAPSPSKTTFDVPPNFRSALLDGMEAARYVSRSGIQPSMTPTAPQSAFQWFTNHITPTTIIVTGATALALWNLVNPKDVVEAARDTVSTTVSSASQAAQTTLATNAPTVGTTIISRFVNTFEARSLLGGMITPYYE